MAYWNPPLHRVVAVAFVCFLGCIGGSAVAQESNNAGHVDLNGRSQSNDFHAIVVAYLAMQNIPDELHGAMLDTLDKRRAESRWSGRKGDQLFAIAAHRLPDGSVRQRATTGMLRLTHAVAVTELLTTRAVLNGYKAEGLTDSNALRAAVVCAAGQLNVASALKGLIHQTAVRDGCAVAYVVADIPNVTAHLRRPASLNEVKAAYRNLIYERMRGSMLLEQWAEAAEDSQHLWQLGLSFEQLFIDAVRCFIELDRDADAIRNAEKFLAAFGETAEPATLEQLGDMLLKVDSGAAQEAAAAAYRAASEQLRAFVSAQIGQ